MYIKNSSKWLLTLRLPKRPQTPWHEETSLYHACLACAHLGATWASPVAPMLTHVRLCSHRRAWSRICLTDINDNIIYFHLHITSSIMN